MPKVKQKQYPQQRSVSLRQRLLLERLVRLQQAGYKDTEIVKILGVSQSAISTWKASTEYLALEAQIASAIVSKLDEEIFDIDSQRLRLRANLVPAAINTLSDLVSQKRDEKLRLAAAVQILDREGSFTVVQKQNVQVETKELTPAESAAADEVVGALKKGKSHVPSSTSNTP